MTSLHRLNHTSEKDPSLSMLIRGKDPRCAPTGTNAHYIAFDIAIDNTACYYYHNTKVRPRTGHEGPEEALRYRCILSLTSALGRVGWLTPRPCRFTPGKMTGYLLYRRLGGPQGRSGKSPHHPDPIPGTPSP